MLFNTIITKLGYEECPAGLTRLGDECYLISNSLRSHTQAAQFCSSLGLQLLSPQAGRQLGKVQDFLQKYSREDCGVQASTRGVWLDTGSALLHHDGSSDHSLRRSDVSFCNDFIWVLCKLRDSDCSRLSQVAGLQSGRFEAKYQLRVS